MLKKTQIVKYLQKISPAKLALLKFGFILVVTVFLGTIFTQNVAADRCEPVCAPPLGDPGSQACADCYATLSDSSIFGSINPPAGVDKFNQAAGGEIGIIIFLSSLIRLATIVAGIWVMINFILAGWTYITNPGDSSVNEKVSKKLINSVIGLAIVALAYTIAAAIGYIIFGDAGYIINPELTTIEDLS